MNVADHQNALFLLEGRPTLIVGFHNGAGLRHRGRLTAYRRFHNRWIYPWHASSELDALQLATDADHPDITAARESLVWMDTMVARVPNPWSVGGSYDRVVGLGDMLVAPELDAVRVAMPGETATWLCVRHIPRKSQVQVAPMRPTWVRHIQ